MLAAPLADLAATGHRCCPDLTRRSATHLDGTMRLTDELPDPIADGVLRPHAEDAVRRRTGRAGRRRRPPRPPGWRLSPWAVVTYLLGGTLPDGTVITPKYVGHRRLIEVAVATLATDRALLLLGVPGTAKTWVSEHLAAAISGDSTLLVQGTAGTAEEAMRYGWNYARLLAEGPSAAALVPSPVYRAMRPGRMVRVEELTRMPADVQDALVTVLSEKTLPVPELANEVRPCTASTSSPRPTTATGASTSCPPPCAGASTPSSCRCRPRPRRRWTSSPGGSPSSAPRSALPRRAGGRRRSAGSSPSSASCASGAPTTAGSGSRSPTGTLSTAEAISVVMNGLALAAHFGDGELRAGRRRRRHRRRCRQRSVHDAVAWREYLETVVRDRDGWQEFYEACRELA